MLENILRKINSISFLTWIDDDEHVILNIPFWVVVVVVVLSVILIRKRRGK